MNWGYKIAIAYGSFVIMILYFLFVASKQENELIENHYYEKEQQFQGVLNASANLASLEVKPEIRLIGTNMQITLPEEIRSEISEGRIEFIRLSDQSKDIHSDFNIDSSGSFYVPGKLLFPGIYQMKIEWQSDGIPYMFREQFNYPKP